MSENVFAHQIIRASAGSGKTFKLSERYLRLLLAGVPVDTILATTFTRKAAGEIQNRILERLGRGAMSEEGAANLSRELFSGDGSRLTREKLLDLTVDLTRSLDKMRVCTLDAFFMRLASGFEFEIGLPPGWRIVEELDDATILRRAIQASFARANAKSAYELSKLLFKGETKRDVESQITRIVRESLEIYRNSTEDAWLKLGRAAPKTKSLEECLEEIQNAELPRNAKKSATDEPSYNGYFVKSRNAIVSALESGSTREIAGLLSGGLCKCVVDGTYKYSKRDVEGDLKLAVEDVVAYARSAVVTGAADFVKALRFTLDAIDRYYDRFKREDGGYRFNDLAQTLSELELNDQLRRVVYRLDAKTSHLLLDEFQDSSPQQWSIIRPFAESIVAKTSDSLNLDDPEDVAKLTSFFCVGDAKQAIYGWRGGVAEIFRLLEETLPNLTFADMAVNWRSCPVVIDAVNDVFENLSKNPLFQREPSDENDTKIDSARKALLSWRDFPHHEVAPRNANKNGYWALEMAPRADAEGDPPLLATRKYARVNRFQGQTEPDELNSRVQTSLESAFDPDQLDDATSETDDRDSKTAGKLQQAATIAYAVERIAELGERYPRRSIGVLTRTNRFLTQLIRGLKARGVHASAEGGAPIVDSPSTLAALALLNLASHPADTVAAYKIATTLPLAERFGVSTSDYQRKARAISGYLRERLATIGIGRFAAETRELLTSAPLEPRDRERLDKFVEFAFTYEANVEYFQLDRFINAVKSTKRESPDVSNISVMTIHASKGLEFDIVVLPELDMSGARDIAFLNFDSLYAGRANPLAKIDSVVAYVGKDLRSALPEEFAQIFREEQRKKIIEGLCLLYVAITRPVRMLVAIVSPPQIPGSKSGKDAEVGKVDVAAANEAIARVPSQLSFANILRFGLASDVRPLAPDSEFFKHAQIIYESGDPNWDVEDEPVEQSAEDGERDESQSPLNFTPTTRKRLLLHRETPTGGRETTRWSPPSSFARGSALHACFEATRWLDVDGPPGVDELERILAPIVVDREEIKRTIEEFRQICETPFVIEALSLASYKRRAPGASASAADYHPGLANPSWDVYRERPFSYLRKDVLCRGVIDRLVILRDGDKVVGADIIDYKSDRFRDPNGELIKDPSNVPQETLDEYRRQLAFYADVVEKWHALPSEKVSARLAFVSHGFMLDAR